MPLPNNVMGAAILKIAAAVAHEIPHAEGHETLIRWNDVLEEALHASFRRAWRGSDSFWRISQSLRYVVLGGAAEGFDEVAGRLSEMIFELARETRQG